MNLPKGKKTKTGWSTSVEVLENLVSENEIVSLILEYRKLSKLKSTYIQGLIDAIGKDGRIHTTFEQTITQTGRLSSTNPNLQNLPIKTELGRDLRKAFIPKEGYSFVDADYSQVELRILAHLSNDETMIEDFNKGKDIHRATAAKIFGISEDDVTANQRRSAKAVNFGLIYGMGSYSLSQDLGISIAKADEYIKNYFNHYPKIKKYLDSLIKKAENDGYVETLYNRRRYIRDINSSFKICKSCSNKDCNEFTYSRNGCRYNEDSYE